MNSIICTKVNGGIKTVAGIDQLMRIKLYPWWKNWVFFFNDKVFIRTYEVTWTVFSNTDDPNLDVLNEIYQN